MTVKCKQFQAIFFGHSLNLMTLPALTGDIMAESDLNGPTITRKIGGTTYIVTSEYSKNATETAVQKMQRLILKDAEKVLKNGK